MSNKRKMYSAKFKAKIALEAYKGDKTAAELVSAHKISSGQISTWKKQLLEGVSQLFETKQTKIIDEETLTSPLYEETGRLKVELDWLKKNLTIPVTLKKLWIEPEHNAISIRRQCELLELNRSTLYYQPEPVSNEELQIMRMIVKIYLQCPFYGSRRITAQLNRDHKVLWNCKRIQRLMSIMGLRGIAPGSDTSKPRKENKIYP